MKIRRKWLRIILLIVVASAMFGAAFSFAQYGAMAHADASYATAVSSNSAVSPDVVSSDLPVEPEVRESGKKLSREDVNGDGTNKDEMLEKLLTVDTDYIAAEWPVYSSNDYGITIVRNQGSHLLCWAYAAMGCLETSLYRQKLEDPEGHIIKDGIGYAKIPDGCMLAKASVGNFDDPLDLIDVDNVNFGKTFNDSNSSIWDTGGHFTRSSITLSRWFGGLNVYDKEWTGYGRWKMRDAITCRSDDRAAIKRLVAEYGAVHFVYRSSDNLANQEYYLARGGWYDTNHASVIIGWDDTVPAQAFNDSGYPEVAQDGAWIVMNTWGGGVHGGDGIYYLSYQSYISQTTAYVAMDANDYDYNYQYSGKIISTGALGLPSLSSSGGEYLAIYQARMGTDEKVETLKGVGLGVSGENASATVRIYSVGGDVRNPDSVEFGEPVSVTRRSFEHTGFYTVPLDTPVPLARDEWYAVRVTMDGGEVIYDTDAAALSDNDLTFFKSGNSWKNADTNRNGVLAIKGFTKLGDPPEPVDISEGYEITLAGDCTYTGEEIRPAVTVKSAEGETVSPAYYSVAYSDNVEVGEATVEVTGRGACSGTLLTTFAITALDISDADIELDNDKFVYTGSAQTPVPVTINGRAVTADNYTLSYSDNVVVGTGQVTVHGTRNLTGEKTLSFDITRAERGELNIVMGSWTYGSVPSKPSVVCSDGEIGEVTFAYGNAEIGPWSETKPTDAGTYYVKAEMAATANYAAKQAVRRFVISPASINGATVSGVTDAVYSGSEICPKPTVALGGITLGENRDYTLSYANNTDAGRATVTVTGRGNYTGKAITHFEITRAEGEATVTIEDWAYKEDAPEPMAVSATNESPIFYYKPSGASDEEYSLDPPTLPGKYTLKAVYPQSANYNAVSATCDFEITKAAAPALEMPTEVTVPPEATLGDITLPEGWEWVEETEITDGQVTAKAVYKGPDAEYYEQTEITVTFNVKTDNAAPNEDDEGTGNPALWLLTLLALPAVGIPVGVVIVVRRKKK